MAGGAGDKTGNNGKDVAGDIAMTDGRVFLFLYTDDFWRDFRSYQTKGVVFVREPKEEPYGTVAVFRDLYGKVWDLLQPRTPAVTVQ